MHTEIIINFPPCRFGRKDVKSIAKYVETRNATQVRTHAQKYFLRMKKEDPEQYARFCEDDDNDLTQNQLPMKRKADDSGPSAYTLVGQPAATMAGLGGGIGTTMAGIPAGTTMAGTALASCR